MNRVAFIESTAKMSGVEFSTLYHARVLSKTGRGPIVVIPREGELSNRCEAAGVRTAILRTPKALSVGARFGNRTIVNPLALLVNGVLLLYSAFLLYRFLRREQSSIVITKTLPSHFYGGLACLLAHIPCVWHVQDRVSERLGRFYPFLLSLAGRFLARHIIADAESILKQLQSLVSRDRITVLWNGVDTEEFSPHIDGTTVRKEWNVADDECLVGSVARITPWKGQHLVLEAFSELVKKHPSVKLVIVGTPLFDNDKYLHRLQHYVTAHRLETHVIFAGFRWDLPQVLAAINIFVHSAVEKDSSPLSVVSAMAAGKPIICPQIDGITELFQDGTDALLYPAGNAELLGRELTRLVTNQQLANVLGKCARQKAVTQFGMDVFASRSEDILKGILQTNHPHT